MDGNEVVCQECFDPTTNPFLDVDETLDDDTFVNICPPGKLLYRL